MNSLPLYAFFIFLTSFAGGLFPLLFPRKNESHLKVLISFGAGLLLSMAFLHMIPESAEMIGKRFGLWVLLGFGILYVMEKFVMVHACEENGCHYHTIGLAAFAGLTIHGLIEGLALGSSAMATELGPLVFIAIVIHKAPAGISLSSILSMAKKRKNQILAFLFGISVSGPLGIWAAYALMKDAQYAEVSGALLALSGGTFLYIGACDLLPELHHPEGNRYVRLLAFFLGIAVSVASGLILPHSH